MHHSSLINSHSISLLKQKASNLKPVILPLSLYFFIHTCKLILGFTTGDRNGNLSTPYVSSIFRISESFLLIMIAIYFVSFVLIEIDGFEFVKSRFINAMRRISRSAWIEITAAIICVFFPLYIIRNYSSLDNGCEWYWTFSNTIYHPQNEYYAESILMPVLASWLKVNQSFLMYKIFALITSILGTLIFSLLLWKQEGLRKYQKFLILSVFYSNTITLINYRYLGMPDPLTTMGVIIMLLASSDSLIFGGGLIATLSHLSVTCFSFVNIVLIKWFSYEPQTLKSKILHTVKLFSSIGIGFIFLKCWYSIFHYAPQARADWSLSRGVPFWVEYNTLHWKELLNLQNIPHIFLLIILFLVFFLNKDKFCWVIPIGFLISFFPTFFTMDRPRIFAMIFWPIIIYSLIELYRNPKIPCSYKQLVSNGALVSLIFNTIFIFTNTYFIQ